MKISRQHFNDSQMTDSNSLAKALLQKPEVLSPIMTHLGGREDKRFPLTMMTEGVGNTKSIEKLEYEYNVTTRVNHTRPVASTPQNTADLGKGGRTFTVTFPDKWFIKDYIVISQSGVQARIMAEPVPNGDNFDYTMQLVSPDGRDFMPAEDVQAGSHFAQMFAPVGTDFSRGNASNWATPSKIRHKLSTIRKSYQMSGNAKDFVVDIALPTSSGTTKLWMDYEEWQYFLQWKQECELFLWYGEQSYDEKGVTQMKDENGQPVVIGPGLLQQIINKESYSELTSNKLKNVIGDLFYGMTDAQNKQVTLYTGTGGAREFDEAMKREIGKSNYTLIDGNHFINGSGRNLELGGFFTTYKHVDGHTVRVVKVPDFDHGPVAQSRRKHPKSGYSLESYRMVFLDQSNYDGQSNVQMINKKGRELMRWAVPGSVVPRGFDQSTSRASDVDGASVHYLKTGGVLLRRFDTSLDMQCDIA